ncbi:IclR family transcriptional regulator [Paenibacillus sp. IB182496]|uniref:IclR family transcriptional regulator n=1 Tax=Paenibacillus sabuli TaxID=2772509 RepID=A0A927GQT3_9BACL|nr:IclR family transcriptional regulator [Paenibacillus sabuli]MBD2844097.1 IclR family transcriptional regulator [Paenibacillus sabuli]
MAKEPKEKEKQERYTVQSIDKSLDLLELLADRGSLSLIELADLLEQPKSSTFRILQTLEHRGYVGRSSEDGKFCLGYKQLSLAKYLMARSKLNLAAAPEMSRLSARFGDTVNLGVLTGEGVIIYIEIIEGTHALRMTETVGSQAPYYATALGKAIAAYLPEREREALLGSSALEALTAYTIADADSLRNTLRQVRARGYALDDQEITLGARCVAVPIFNMQGRVEGGLSLSGPMHRFEGQALTDIMAELLRAGAEISARMGCGLYPPAEELEH